VTTEYEQLLMKMVDEKKAKLAEVSGRKGKEKQAAALMSDMRFLEVELQRYQQGMALFRTKGLPKVGRWGMPEAEGKKEESTQTS
jgi:arginine utilization protein RocB